MTLIDSGQCTKVTQFFNAHIAAWETWVAQIEFAASFGDKANNLRGFLQQIVDYDAAGIPLTTSEKAVVEEGLTALFVSLGLNNFAQGFWVPAARITPDQELAYDLLRSRFVDLDGAATPQVPRESNATVALKVFDAFPPYGNEVTKFLKYCPNS